jgi:hypothetical protein
MAYLLDKPGAAEITVTGEVEGKRAQDCHGQWQLDPEGQAANPEADES